MQMSPWHKTCIAFSIRSSICVSICGALSYTEPCVLGFVLITRGFYLQLMVSLDFLKGFPGGSVVKNLPAMQETQVPFLGWDDPLEKEMATHSSIPAWEIPWTEEAGGLESMRLQKSQTRLLVTKPQQISW